jgi:imidazolonepropionase-like amidohydrolase
MGLHIRGTILPDGVERDVFVFDGRLTFEADADAETILDGGYLIPGLVDAHAHLSFASPAGDDATWADKASASAALQLEAGVLVIRDPGGVDGAVRGIGPSVGLPRVFTANRFLATPGRMFPGHGQLELPEAEIADAADAELDLSTGWVKLVGDFPAPSGRFETSFSPETLSEIARRVHARRGRLAIHAVTAETIDGAIEAGVDSVEHGLMMQPEQAAAMADHGIALVPTMVGSHAWPGILRSFGAPEDEIARSAAAIEGHAGTVRAAWEAGVQVLAGTDAGLVSHGLVRKEVEALIDAGVPAKEALGAASWSARDYLGLTGGLTQGGPADIVAYRGNPLEDPAVLADPILVVLDGQVVRSPATT